MKDHSITPGQCRAARAFLKWKTSELAERAAIGINTVTRFEAGHPTHASTAKVIEGALRKGGITFTPEGGINPAETEI